MASSLVGSHWTSESIPYSRRRLSYKLTSSKHFRSSDLLVQSHDQKLGICPTENRKIVGAQNTKALLITNPTTQDLGPLPFAKCETETVARLLHSSVSTEVLECPQKSDILSKMQQSSFVHFACHGMWAPDPSQSFICLADWKRNALSVVNMVKLKLDHAQFAYLSACHGSNNRELTLLDEEIHMAGACQLAGFPSVIGALSKITDVYSPVIAEDVYRAMKMDNRLDVQKGAYGLHHGLRKIRQETRSEKGAKGLDDPA